MSTVDPKSSILHHLTGTPEAGPMLRRSSYIRGNALPLSRRHLKNDGIFNTKLPLVYPISGQTVSHDLRKKKGPDNPTSQLLPIMSNACCSRDGEGRKDKGRGGEKMVCDKVVCVKDGVVKDGV